MNKEGRKTKKEAITIILQVKWDKILGQGYGYEGRKEITIESFLRENRIVFSFV